MNHVISLRPSDEMLTKGQGVVSLLRDLVKCDAIALTAWDPFHQADKHHLVASEGYADDLMNDILMSYRADNPGYRILRSHAPLLLRWQDLARDWKIDFAETPIAIRYLLPQGINEGLTAFLCLPDRHHVGAIHMSWMRPQFATDERREIVDRFQPLLADTTNLLHSYQVVANQLVPEVNVMVLSGKHIQRIPGRESGSILNLSEFTPHLEDLAARSGSASFLLIDGSAKVHRIQSIRCADKNTLITEQPIDPPFRLTLRELEVVDLLAEGESNTSIASKLCLSPRTVGSHVENILVKMNCASRAQIAGIAAREGIRLLPRLASTE